MATSTRKCFVKRRSQIPYRKERRRRAALARREKDLQGYLSRTSFESSEEFTPQQLRSSVQKIEAAKKDIAGLRAKLKVNLI